VISPMYTVPFPTDCCSPPLPKSLLSQHSGFDTFSYDMGEIFEWLSPRGVSDVACVMPFRVEAVIGASSN
jgi:hypothetical protein